MSLRLGNHRVLAFVSGMPIYPIRGSEEDEQNLTGTPADLDNRTKSGDNNGGDGEDNGNDREEDGDGEDKGTNAVSQEAYDKLHRRMTAADKRANAAEKRLQEFDDKDKSELEKSQRDLSEAVKSRDALRAQTNQLLIEREFLKNGKHKWHDSGAALKLVDLSSVEIDDEGNVTGMDEAVKKVAKDYPFLIASASGADEPKSGTKQPTGSQPNGSSNGKQLDQAAMKKKWRLNS